MKSKGQNEPQKNTPWGILCFQRFGCNGPKSEKSKLSMYRISILVLTFITYMFYHMSRRPLTVVKTKFIDCPEPDETTTIINELNVSSGWTRDEIYGKHPNSIYPVDLITNKLYTDDEICSSWFKEVDGKTHREADTLLSSLDTTYLLSYAIFMFVSGMIADRLDLRYFLSGGMICSGIITMIFGLSKYWNIHSLIYYDAVQFVTGVFQTSGWPGVVAVIGNWFGHGKKGLIMGIWNSHTSIGNIIGATIAGSFVEDDWGLSFIVPGAMIAIYGVVIWMFLVPRPEDVDLQLESNTDETQPSKSKDENKNEEGKSRKISRRLSVISSHIDGKKAVSFFGALRIPGVLEYSFSLFFAKLVSYTFLYWLPTFIKETGDGVSSEDAAYFSTWFDIGGLLGGIIAGLATDITGMSASVCSVMLIGAIPLLFGYKEYNFANAINTATHENFAGNTLMLIACGILVNGPYCLITTAVSADLGNHPSLKGSSKALATVTAIIDGTGSIGAAVGPFMAGAIPGKDTQDQLNNVFYMLMGADVVSLILLTRLVYKEIKRKKKEKKEKSSDVIGIHYGSTEYSEGS